MQTLLYEVEGRRLFLESAGEGGPTVVFEAGAGSSSSTWDPIWASSAAITRVCRYDRPNLGQSDISPVLRSPHDVVADLHTLLEKASVPGPYILVGHSFGGLVVRLFAHRYPDEVVGAVFIDSSHPLQYKRSLDLLPPPGPGEHPAIEQARSRYSDPDTPLPEGINFGQTLAEAARTGPVRGRRPSDGMLAGRRLGASAGAAPADIPVAVVSRSRPVTPEQFQQVRPGLPLETAAALEDLWQELQADLASLSKRSIHLTATQSGHYVHRDQPGLVVDAITRVVQMARESA